MPRTHVRVLGSRKYADYTEDALQSCLAEIRAKTKTQRQASQFYGIPRSTINNKLKNRFDKHPGRQTVFSQNEEKVVCAHIMKLSEYGFPITEYDLRCIMKSYLDKRGQKVGQFKKNDNMPGYEWCKSFIKRHTEITTRICSNIKRERAAIDETIINNYFDNLEQSINDIPAQNIWNYDETNLSDDPGTTKVLCKKGSKYIERILNSSKACTSLMLCGNATGELMPLYIVYKADHLWSTWTEGGPEKCRYNRSKSGWFDTAIFEDWFFSLLLPRLKRQEGVKVLIGDNLSSHINISVIEACEENNIRFVCLPPHSTHLTQPLDVAYFHPMKVAWRKILQNWRKTSHGQKTSTLQKDQFPKLLKVLTEALMESKGENLVSGFRKCGIVPLNRNQVLDRIPKRNLQVTDISDAFLNALAERRETAAKPNQMRKRKKLNVEAGKSICLEQFEDVQPETSAENASKRPQKRCRSKKSIESSDDSDHFSVHDDSADDDVFNSIIPTSDEENDNAPITMARDAIFDETWKDSLKQGDFVAVLYNGQKYPGEVVQIISKDVGVVVSCMQKLTKSWKWPEKTDLCTYKWHDVFQKIKPPKPLRRGFYSVSELDNFSV